MPVEIVPYDSSSTDDCEDTITTCKAAHPDHQARDQAMDVEEEKDRKVVAANKKGNYWEKKCNQSNHGNLSGS